MLKIIGFKTEYQTNPLGIANRKPKFSWKYDTDFNQKTYRIIVSEYEKNVLADIGDVWDSGKVVSPLIVGIEFDGKNLKTRTKYFVKVTCESDDGKIVESEVNSFETAILDESDWKGSWTAMPVNFVGGALRFRKVLTVPKDKKVVKARAYVCGLGYHEFYVNGKKVGNSVLNPSVTEYSERVMYVTYDFTDMLEFGLDNVVAFELGYGWYGDRKLMAQFYFELEDGTILEDHSQPCYGWWVSGSETIDNSIYGGEVYDATLEAKYPLNWNTRDFEPTWANGWMYTIATDAPKGKLEAQEIEPIVVAGEFKTVSVKKLAENVFVYDVGQNLAGWAYIRVKGDRGSKVTLKFAEDLKEDGSVNQLNLRSARCSDAYILKGEGEEEFEPKYTYHGFRYVQAEIDGNAEILSLVAKHVHSDVKRKGSFECSDEVINQLHKNAQITEINNLHSIMTDCPQRDERFGWLNDLGSRLFQTVYNYGMEKFFPKFVSDITHTETAEGAIKDTAPYYTGGIPADPVCIAYLLFGTLSYKYYGNKSVCVDEYIGFKKWVDYLLSRSVNYIMDYYYYADWVPPVVFEDVHTDGIYISTVYLNWHLKTMAKVAKIAGNESDYKKYDEMSKASDKAINEKYFNSQTYNYSTGTQSENSIALWLGIVPSDCREKVALNVYNETVKHNHHSTCGNIGYRHLFYALSDYGYTDEVVKILTNPEYPGWGYMIAHGATTVWERWESEMQNIMHSFDHPMFGSYDAWLYHYLGGIAVDDDACGADKITIKPYIPTDISYVNCSFETIRGTIISNWKKNGNSVKYHIEVPPMTTAKIRLGLNDYVVGCGKYDFEI